MILRQSTEIKVRVGPAVDATDGVTPETGVTLGAADQAEALKANGAATVDISAATWAAVTGADGWYDLTLTTSYTDTVGTLDIVIQDSSVCLPIFCRFQVVEEAVYDALYAASAVGPALASVCTEGRLAELDAANLVADVAAVKAETALIVADTNELQTDDIPGTLATLATSAALATVDGIVDAILLDTAELQTDWANGGRLDLIIDAVLDDTNAILTDTGTTIPATLATIDGIVDAIVLDTAEIGAAGAGLTDLGGMSTAMKAEVLAEVVKVLVTQMTESYAADGVAPTLTQALMLIQQHAGEQVNVGTTRTVKKLDGVTTAATFLYDATTPTSITRST